MNDCTATDSRTAGSPGRRRAALTRLCDAFAWPLRTSHYLELVNPLWASHSPQARLEDIREEAAGARTLILRPGPSWRGYRPGQFVRVGVQIDGALHTRTYSISSCPERGDGCIAITVKPVAGGRVSPYLARRIEPGSYLSLGRPEGDFVLADARPQRLLFITAGSGITPVVSMLRSLDARGAMPDVLHLHYAPRRADVIFGDELEQMAARHPRYRLRLLYTREPGFPDAGRFGAQQLERLCPDWPTREAYACGPQGLLDAVETHWRGEDLAHKLSIERFRAALAEPPADALGGRARFASSNVECDVDGVTSLLRVAEDAGLTPPHGCRMGICHSCTTTLLSGCVRDLRTNHPINEPGSQVQLCVCAAAGDVELAL